MPLYSINTDGLVKGHAQFDINLITNRISMTEANTSGVSLYMVAKNFGHMDFCDMCVIDPWWAAVQDKRMPHAYASDHYLTTTGYIIYFLNKIDDYDGKKIEDRYSEITA